LVPIVANIFLSFTDYDLNSLGFIGLKNYQNLLRDSIFLTSLKNTLIYTIFTLSLTIVLGLFVAVALNKNLRGVKFFRTAFFIPYVTSMAAASMIWLWMYEPSHGIFNKIIALFNISPKNWLYDYKLALGSIILISIWKFIGYNMVIYLAGLQGIPASIYEAATVDGASSIHKFRHITIPMLRPVTFFLFVTGFINNFNVFEQVNILTEGGPMNSTTTVVHQIYTRAFTDFQMGYASSITIVLIIIVAVITLMNFKYGNQGQELDISRW